MFMLHAVGFEISIQFIQKLDKLSIEHTFRNVKKLIKTLESKIEFYTYYAVSFKK